jgi:hypothetical protein
MGTLALKEDNVFHLQNEFEMKGNLVQKLRRKTTGNKKLRF